MIGLDCLDEHQFSSQKTLRYASVLATPTVPDPPQLNGMALPCQVWRKAQVPLDVCKDGSVIKGQIEPGPVLNPTRSFGIVAWRRRGTPNARQERNRACMATRVSLWIGIDAEKSKLS